MTFPGGTHDLWIRYWLAAGGIDPDKDIETIVVPPPQMVANMKVGTMDGFCVGEPWNEQLVHQNIGYTAITTGELWNEHPEKSFAHARRLGRQVPECRKGAADGRHGGAAVVRQGGEPRRGRARSSAKRAMVQRARSADMIDRIKGNFDYGDGRMVEGQPACDEVTGATTPPIRSRATTSGSSPRTCAGASSSRRSTPRR